MLLAVLLLQLGAGAVIAEEAPPATVPQARPSPEDLRGLSPEEVMQRIDAWGMESEQNKIISYVTAKEIHVEFPDGPTLAFALPAERRLVAIAPYIRKTHACSTHYPSSCLGELPNTAVRATVTDAGGAPVLAIETSTQANGFLELWLPPDGEFNLTIEARGLKASGPLSTAPGADTCLTTLQLHP